MRTRTIGNDTVGRLEVGAIGFGCYPLDGFGPGEREQLLDTLQAALDSGVTLFDTADAYGPDELEAEAQGANEILLVSLLNELDALDRVVIATKGGYVRGEGGAWLVDGSHDHLLASVDDSLQRLGLEQLPLWQLHCPDLTVPWEETCETLAEIADSGKVRMVGLSNVDAEQVRAAHGVLGDRLVSVQNRFSPTRRRHLPEVELCTELGLAFLPWSPLGGVGDAKNLAEAAPAFAAVASDRGVSPQQVALAWEMSLSPNLVPIPGARRRESVEDSAAAADLELTAEELERLNA